MTKPTKAEDMTGCALLAVSIAVCVALGIGVIGSYFPEEVRTAFLVALAATVAATVLSCILVIIRDARSEP